MDLVYGSGFVYEFLPEQGHYIVRPKSPSCCGDCIKFFPTLIPVRYEEQDENGDLQLVDDWICEACAVARMRKNPDQPLLIGRGGLDCD